MKAKSDRRRDAEGEVSACCTAPHYMPAVLINASAAAAGCHVRVMQPRAQRKQASSRGSSAPPVPVAPMSGSSSSSRWRRCPAFHADSTAATACCTCCSGLEGTGSVRSEDGDALALVLKAALSRRLRAWAHALDACGCFALNVACILLRCWEKSHWTLLARLMIMRLCVSVCERSTNGRDRTAGGRTTIPERKETRRVQQVTFTARTLEDKFALDVSWWLQPGVFEPREDRWGLGSPVPLAVVTRRLLRRTLPRTRETPGKVKQNQIH